MFEAQFAFCEAPEVAVPPRLNALPFSRLHHYLIDDGAFITNSFGPPLLVLVPLHVLLIATWFFPVCTVTEYLFFALDLDLEAVI